MKVPAAVINLEGREALQGRLSLINEVTPRARGWCH